MPLGSLKQQAPEVSSLFFSPCRKLNIITFPDRPQIRKHNDRIQNKASYESVDIDQPVEWVLSLIFLKVEVVNSS
jgi:hypothetical protein